MIDKHISYKYMLTALLAVLVTWIMHEFAHWAASEFLGYDTIMTLNATYPTKGQGVSEWHYMLISAAGPLMTIFQAIAVFVFLKSTWSKHLYLFLFTAFYMRFLAGIMNIIKPNDEGRISTYLEIGLYTLPALVSAVLFYLLYHISKKYHLGSSFQLKTLLIIIVLTSVLILTNQFIGVRIL